jgi:DNA-binding GntR family transcriptional regulator
LYAIVAATNAVRIHAELRQDILDGTVAAGKRLRAEAIAERFGTSRTPVREALQRLEGEGLVELPANRGAIVAAFDRDDVLDLYEIRAVVEAHAAARAATRMAPAELERLSQNCATAERLGDAVAEQMRLNEEFHRIITAGARSPRLTAAMRGVSGIPRAFRAVFWADDAQRAQSLSCHRQLVEACAARDAELAEAVMRMHILGARRFLLDRSDG